MAEFELVGGRGLARKFQRLDSGIGRAVLLRATAAGADQFNEGAARRAPLGDPLTQREAVRDIVLKREFVKEVDPRGSDSQASHRAGPSDRTFYFYFRELGLDGNPAQPHMRPTIDEDGRDIAATINTIIRDELEREVARARRV